MAIHRAEQEPGSYSQVQKRYRQLRHLKKLLEALVWQDVGQATRASSCV